MAKHKVTALPAGPYDPSDVYYLLVDDRVHRWIVSNDGISLKQECPMQTGDDISLLNNDSAFQTFSEVSALIAAATSPAISDNYATIAALLAAQGSQTENYIYIVVDATTDATVDLGWALYQKLAATTGVLGDYRKLSEEESLDVVAGSTTPTTTLGDMIVRGATEDERLPVGADGSVLQVDLAQPNKIKWSVLDSFKYARYMNTSEQSADSATAFALQWNVIEHEDSDYSLVANQITINANGVYLINANIDLYGTTTLLRYGGEVKILINGVELPNVFRGGYVRGDSQHQVAQIFVGIMLQLAAGDTIDFTLRRTHSLSTNIIVQNGTTLSIGRISGGAVGPSGNDGADGADGDISWQGPYIAGTYILNQAVEYNGSSYVCVVASTTELPTHADWDLIAEKGGPGVGGAPRQWSSRSYIVINTGGAGVWRGGTFGSTALSTSFGATLSSVNGNDLTSFFVPFVNCKLIGVSMQIQAVQAHGVVSLGVIKYAIPNGDPWYQATFTNKAVLLEEAANGGGGTAVQRTYNDRWDSATGVASTTILAGEVVSVLWHSTGGGSTTAHAVVELFFEEV
jgi:hypothetical protein